MPDNAKNLYTAWGTDGSAYVCVPGTQRPAILLEPGDVLIWTIEADSWEAAMTEYHRLQGWEPYVPQETTP